MSFSPGNLFIPKIKQKNEDKEVTRTPETDNVGLILMKTMQYLIVILFGLLPIFFIPSSWNSLGFDKSFFTVAIGALIVVLISLLMLRRSKSSTVIPVSLLIFWIFVVVTLVSGLMSSNSGEALRGSLLEIHTVSFLAILGLVMTISLVIQGSKRTSIKALALFGLSAILVLAYNVIRLLFDATAFSLGNRVFENVTVSPVGGFNDLAIFAALVIIMSIITLVQLPLKIGLRLTMSVLIIGSLIVLSIINFFNIWIAVGFFALLVLVYLLSRDTIFGQADSPRSPLSRLLLGVVGLVCLVSAVFIVSGDYVGNKINNITNIRYSEVQPTLTATFGIAKSVYREDVVLGIGPNQFSEAWRQHKDLSINQTIFWDTTFDAGSGFVPTLFITTGLLGGILMIIFHLYFLYLGYKMLLRTKTEDSYWYFFGSVSFAAAFFIWGMSYVYVPGAAVLLLGAMFTGFTYVAAGALLPEMVKTIPLTVNRQRGFFVMAATILMITVSIGTLFSTTKQYVAQANFFTAAQSDMTIEEFSEVAANSFRLYPDDNFVNALAQIQLSKLNSLLAVQEPTEEEQRQFLAAAEEALSFSEAALEEDPNSPNNYAIRAAIFSNLAIAGIDGAKDRVDVELEKASQLDPLNPGYDLISAQLAAQIGDAQLAKKKIGSALKLKPNFTQAMYLSAQIDIAQGNTEEAIKTTRSILTFEPNNSTLYFQLGVLLSAENRTLEAIEAYKSAININPVYANARYLLALAYMQADQPALALSELRVVQSTNPENIELQTVIEQIESGTYVAPPEAGLEVPVNESSPNAGFDDDVVTDEDVDTDLVSPVNVIVTEEETDEVVSSPEVDESSEDVSDDSGVTELETEE